MNISQIMTKKVAAVDIDDTLERAYIIFTNLHFHHLLVLRKDKLAGVVSDRDLLKVISPNVGTINETVKDTATLNKKIHQIMSRDLVTLKPEQKLIEAIEVFNNNQVSCIPIMNDDDKPVGIVSWRDILNIFGSAKDV